MSFNLCNLVLDLQKFFRMLSRILFVTMCLLKPQPFHDQMPLILALKVSFRVHLEEKKALISVFKPNFCQPLESSLLKWASFLNRGWKSNLLNQFQVESFRGQIELETPQIGLLEGFKMDSAQSSSNKCRNYLPKSTHSTLTFGNYTT